MKKTLLIAFLISNICAMSQGKIYLKTQPFCYNKINTFIYIPPKDVFVPDFSFVSFKEMNRLDIVPLVKVNGHYEFIYKCSEETKVVFFDILDCNLKAIEKNYGRGYFFNVSSKPDNNVDVLKQKLSLIGEFKGYSYKLKISNTEIKNQFDYLFKKYPSYKDSFLRYNYLQLCNEMKVANYTEKELQECLIRLVEIGSENGVDFAYKTMGKEMGSEKILKIINAKYPKGNIVSNNTGYSFVMQQNTDKVACDSFINYFKTTFPDNKTGLEKLYFYLGSNFIDKNKFDLALQYANLMSDKVKISGLYNLLAIQLLNKENATTNELNFAEEYSRKSIKLMNDTLSHLDKFDRAVLQIESNSHIDTYASILYKLGNYERAFQVQDSIRKLYGLHQFGQISYATYLEKLKGLKPVKEYYDYIVKQHLATDEILKAMKVVYQKLNLPTTAITKIETERKLEFEKIEKSDIIKRFGNFKSRNFKLKDMQGNEVELAKLKGKVVVMDFWATWCLPCIGSFPHVQELADKYKNENIVFLAINTFEKGTEDVIRKKVKSFLDEKKYTLNVLFDTGGKVAALYGIENIPQTFVIDKNGNIANMLQPRDLTEEMIEKALK